jgi:hypothetical protein
MTCERCTKGFRFSAGDPCEFCNYPYEQHSQFREFMQARAATDPIAELILSILKADPRVPEAQIMFLAISNYANCADQSKRILHDLCADAKPLRRLV